MQDMFRDSSDTAISPARSAVPVVPSDAAAMPHLPKAPYVGSAGNIALRCIDDQQEVVFQNVAAGTILPVRAAFVRASGTTAAQIVAFC
ncbi:spike base protein, RCAP_Rcc01079 family [Sphingomonas panni]